MNRGEKLGFLGMNAFLSFFFFTIIFGVHSCSKETTCQDCVVRCRPFDVKSCNVDRTPGGDWRPTCVCVDKMEVVR